MLQPNQIGIFETSLGGHRGNYVRILIEALNEIGVQPNLLLPESEIERPEYHEFLANMEDRLRLVPTSSIQATDAKSVGKGRYLALTQSVKVLGLRHVYIPYADGLIQWLGYQRILRRVAPELRSCAIEGLLLRGGFAYPSNSLLGSVKKRISLHLILKAALQPLHRLDPRAYRYLRDRYGSRCGIIQQMPELLEIWGTTSKEVALKTLFPDFGERGLASLPLIACPGLVDDRKGVDLLLESFAQGRIYESARLVLAGVHSDTIRLLLKTRYASLVESGSILTVDRFLTEEEFRSLFWMSQLICLPYPNHVGVSSIYLRAAALGKQILTSDRGWFEWAVPHYGIGTSVNVMDTSRFADAIHDELKASHRDRLNAIERGALVLADNSEVSVKASWMHSVRSRLHGRPLAAHRDQESIQQ
jgi:glycosyltransferase involved in cell wall biosynthesis